MLKTRVGVVRGGPSNEYEVSLKTGAHILNALSKEKYQVRDILIDRVGGWYVDGREIQIGKLPAIIDVAVNALHGEYGEDGGFQRDLDRIGLPYTGSGAFGSSAAANKLFAKNLFVENNINTPEVRIVEPEEDPSAHAYELFRNFMPPYVVKPVSAGSSVGVFIVRTKNDLQSAITEAREFSDIVLVEEYIKGREVTCGVIDGENATHALHPVEIIIPDNDTFFDYDFKYSGKAEEICPAHIAPEKEREIQRMAVAAHNALGLQHYSRSDFIISPRGIFLLETNSLPGMTTESLFPKELKAADMEVGEFLDYVIGLAMR